MKNAKALLSGFALLILTACNLTASFQQDDISTPIAVENIADEFPMDWPLEPFSDKQIAEAKDCSEKLTELVEERYPGSLSNNVLESAFTPETACDWAALAVAYGEREAYEAGTEAYLTAIYLNPAYSAITELLVNYFGSQTLVEAPPFLEQPVTVTIQYSYIGLGYTGDYTITITDVQTNPYVTGSGSEKNDYAEENTEAVSYTVDSPLSPETAGLLTGMFTDLIPVDTEPLLIACYDDYPDWTMELIYADGTSIAAKTNESNVLGAGGPWLVTIDDQVYIQLSAGILDAVIAIHDELELPWGQTAAMSCFDIPSILQEGFPDR